MADNPNPMPERRALLQALAAQAAAWWRQRLEGHGYLSDFDNGDTSWAGETAQVMASMAALRSPRQAPERLARFEQVLAQEVLGLLLRQPTPAHTPAETEVLAAEWARRQSPEQVAERLARRAASPARDVVLRTDYAPEEMLGIIADQTRVSGFPWKTTMWVYWDADPDKCYVEVRAGYNRPTQRLPARPATAA